MQEVVAYYKALPRYFLGGFKDIHEKPVAGSEI
jgi:hypothetical protein